MWLAGIFLVLIALLSVPVGLAFQLRIAYGVEGRLTITWLFGLLRIPIRLNGKRTEKKEAKRHRKRKKAKSGGRRKFFFSADFWKWLRRLLRSLLNRIRIVRLFLHMRLGLGDPADTGRLWAYVGPVAALMANIPVADIRLEPSFMEAEFVLRSEGDIRFIPITLIATAVATVLSPATWRVFRQTRAKR